MARDPYRFFRVEARELLDALAKGALELERGDAVATIPAMLRAAHTLKGAARVVRQLEIGELAHALEDLLVPFRETGGAVPRSRVDELLALVDEMGRRVAKLGAPPAEPSTAAASSPKQTETAPAITADFEGVDGVIDGIAETQLHLAGATQALESLERASRLAGMLVDELVRRADGGGAAAALSLAEELHALCGTVERNGLASAARASSELSHLREVAERLRLVPVKDLFTSLARTARDVAHGLGRRVSFEGRGGDVCLDAQMLTVVSRALVQLVRNAVAHGIEAQDARRAAGKSAEGTVRIEVYRTGSRVTFRCVDDGRGVDLDAVRRALVRKGIEPARTSALDGGELLQQLLVAGISTSESITEAAGRGVGMDVVREAVERLRGDVAVHSVAGKGTTVEIVVPFSAVSLDALVVDPGSGHVAIPVEAVVRTLRVGPGDIATTPEGSSIVCDGETVPFAPLDDLLGRRGSELDAEWRGCCAVVIRGRGGLAALGVERLVRVTDLVVRPLPEQAFGRDLAAGASLDSEGVPRLVLDADAAVVSARTARSVSRRRERPPQPILVVDDSLTTRMLEQSILESAGYEVDLATSAEEALERLQYKRYSLLLVDVEMPGMDGFVFIERIRADASLRDIPAILVTSRGSPEDRRRGEQVGASAHLDKTAFDERDLLAKIRSLLERT